MRLEVFTAAKIQVDVDFRIAIPCSVDTSEMFVLYRQRPPLQSNKPKLYSSTDYIQGMLVTIQFRIFFFFFFASRLLSKNLHITIHKTILLLVVSLIRVRNFVSQTAGVSEQGAEENIWT